MAGKIISIEVKKDQIIDKGQTLLLIESMKMEIPLTSEYKGKIQDIYKKVGDFLNQDEPIIELEMSP